VHWRSQGVVTITKIDVDPIMKTLKDAYLKAGDIKDDPKFWFKQ
jgi:Holliday junction resolvase RusA-like endonuclease